MPDITFSMPGIPECINRKVNELYTMVSANPDYLSVQLVARFLHANEAGLRNYIESGKCPFGISWQQDVFDVTTRGKRVGTTHKGNRAFKIPTPTFFFWYMSGAAGLSGLLTAVGNNERNGVGC